MGEKFVIGDVHGCYKTLLALLKKLPKNAEICFVGDLIDRGARSADVIELIIQNDYKCVMGNHEYRLIANENMFLENKIPSDERWYHINGGKQTFLSYKNRQNLKQKHLDFLKTLPLYLEFEIKNAKNLVVSHSAVGEMWRDRKNVDLKDAFCQHLLCQRGDRYENEDIFNIYGHTPLNEPFIGKSSANIDLGAVYGKDKVSNPRLCAIAYPSLEIITQKNIE